MSTSSGSTISKSFPVDERCELSDSLSDGDLKANRFEKTLKKTVVTSTNTENYDQNESNEHHETSVSTTNRYA